MNKKACFIIPILASLMLLCSCISGGYSLTKVKCTLTVNDRITVSYNDKEYVIVNETLEAKDVGKWVGNINKNVSGVMFASVYTDKQNDDMIDISIDDAFFRAIAADKLEDGRCLFELGANASVQAGVQTVQIDENNAMRLIYNGNVYKVTDRRVDESDLGAFVCSIARSLICDAATGRIIPKDEALAMDWDGSLEQSRKTMDYGSVYLIKDNMKELAVEINGSYYIADKA